VKPRFLDAAEAEFLHAIAEYEKEREGLGDEFRAEVMDTVRQIGRDPLQFSLYEGLSKATKARRAIVTRFPYVVIFDVRPDEILIVAVSHGHQRPGYWKNR
jgi:plasmid stabilization system protein ParE